jgi:molecular chaperone GrpE
MINKLRKMMSDKEETTKEKKSKSKKNKDHQVDETLQQELENMKMELEEARDKYLRLFAEFDNYKKRSVKERFELLKTAAQETILSLLPVLDDFDRAKKSSDEGNEVFSEGVRLVYNKLYSTLELKGLKVMESNGLAFDPELHEAITNIPAPSDDLKGKVIDTIEKGYTLNDKIIRYAKVVVAE